MKKQEKICSKYAGSVFEKFSVNVEQQQNSWVCGAVGIYCRFAERKLNVKLLYPLGFLTGQI